MASDALLLGRSDLRGLRRGVAVSATGEFADKFNNMPKYVVSSTLTDPGVDATRP